MNTSGSLVSQLFSIRNRYGEKFLSQKLNLLNALAGERIKAKRELQLYYGTLLFIIAYPDNKTIYKLASRSLLQLQLYIQSHKKVKNILYNSGIGMTQLCAVFGFEIVKWLRKTNPDAIRLSSFEADNGSIRSILSVVMPVVESEILQDANTTWKRWLGRSMKKGENMLDRLIALFDQAAIRPEIRDELWNALGINVEINLSLHGTLPSSLTQPYSHRSLLKKHLLREHFLVNPARVDLNEREAEKIIECSRMILVRHFREIDPISFTAAGLVSYYLLPRGLSVALMGMVPERRHPIDSYMGYMVFKNGLPVAYAGSWILFDSGRIGLNVFPAYRGGESQYIFEQVLMLHRKVYHLKRFSVDPYQLGKENSDGIHSGAFWVYYHAGFRPVRREQQELAEAEAMKIKSVKGYRSPASALAKLADSRMEMIMQRNAVRFDATDLSRLYAGIVADQYSNDRKQAEEFSFNHLCEWLQLKDFHEEKLKFIVKNWSILLWSKETEQRGNAPLKKLLKKIFRLKASGAEEDYIRELQLAGALRKYLEKLLKENTGSLKELHSSRQ